MCIVTTSSYKHMTLSMNFRGSTQKCLTLAMGRSPVDSCAMAGLKSPMVLMLTRNRDSPVAQHVRKQLGRYLGVVYRLAW